MDFKHIATIQALPITFVCDKCLSDIPSNIIFVMKDPIKEYTFCYECFEVWSLLEIICQE